MSGPKLTPEQLAAAAAIAAVSWYAETPEHTSALLLKIRDGPPPKPVLGQGLFYRGQLHTLFGEPDAGKSLLMAAIVARAVNDGARVLWLDWEQGGERTLRRLVDFGAEENALILRLHRVHYPWGEPPIETIHGLGDEVDIVVVDAFTGLLSSLDLNSNSDVDVERAYAKVLRPFADMGAAIVVIDHVAKSREGRGRWAIGSGRKVGASDVALGFEAKVPFRIGKGGRARLSIARDRDGAVAPCDFVLEPDMTWRLEERDSTTSEQGFRPTVLMERISIYLEAQSVGVSGRNIEQNVEGAAEWKRKALALLVEDDYVAVAEGPKRSVLHTSKQPFRKDSNASASSASQCVSSASRRTEQSSASSASPPYKGDALTDALEPAENSGKVVLRPATHYKRKAAP